MHMLLCDFTGIQLGVLDYNRSFFVYSLTTFFFFYFRLKRNEIELNDN